jgi:putative tryptophan/tyrosine transport system substrate-binding protein
MIARRTFVAGLGAAAAWPLGAQAQQASPPVVAVLNPAVTPRFQAAFRKGLGEAGYVEGHNVTVEYHALGDYSRSAEVVADVVKRGVAVIVALAGSGTVLAVKNATATTPVVFGVGDDPVKLGLVASLARPGGNATGVNFFNAEVNGKRLRLLHELVPKAVNIAVLLQPANPASAEATAQQADEVARALGLRIETFKAQTIAQIDAAFATFSRARPDALLVAPDGFFNTRAVQFATLAARERLPAAFGQREHVEAGALMSYGVDSAEWYSQMGAYVGKILKGAKPADLPVLQSTKFEFLINLQTARALGIEVTPNLLAIADEVIE